jgi:hypothetical protein
MQFRNATTMRNAARTSSLCSSTVARLLVGMAAARHWPDIDAGMCAALIWGGLTTFVGPLMQLDRQSEWANA